MDKDPTSSDELPPETDSTAAAEEPKQEPEVPSSPPEKPVKAEESEEETAPKKPVAKQAEAEAEPKVEEKTEEPAFVSEGDSGIDLSALQGFDFGTSWSESKPLGGGGKSFDRRPGRGSRPPRGDRSDRKDRRSFKPGGFRKGPRRDDRDQGGRPDRQGQGSRHQGRPDIPKKVVEVSFYPEENGFKALCKALRISTITYELFDIARTILEKDERFYMIIRPVDAKGAPDEEACLYVSEADGIPFQFKDAALQHALANCLDHFFTSETKEVEPPSGSFSAIRKCGFTGELLGPPNFHRIQKIMADHHASRLSNMPYAKFESRIESVTEEEVIAEWLEKMKTQTSYTLKEEFGEARGFEDGETARAFIKANLADKLVLELKSARVEGSQISKVKDGLLRANLEFSWERQKRFPLDTANLLRGRLRRKKFALYKKGSKGVSYVCAVKRRFREPNESFSDAIQELLTFLDANGGMAVKDLSEKYLRFTTVAAEGEEPVVLTDEQQAKHKAMTMDFQWLLKEGYIAEYSNGTIFAHPPAAPGEGVVPPKAGKPAAKESKPKEPSKAEASPEAAVIESPAEVATPDESPSKDSDSAPKEDAEPVDEVSKEPAPSAEPDEAKESDTENAEEVAVAEAPEPDVVEVPAESEAPAEEVVPETVTETVESDEETEAPSESSDAPEVVEDKSSKEPEANSEGDTESEDNSEEDKSSEEPEGESKSAKS